MCQVHTTGTLPGKPGNPSVQGEVLRQGGPPVADLGSHCPRGAEDGSPGRAGWGNLKEMTGNDHLYLRGAEQSRALPADLEAEEKVSVNNE